MRRQTETIQSLHKQCGDFEKLLGDAKILTKNIKNSTGKVLDGLQELSRQIGKRADYCAICFENFTKDSKILECKHKYHIKCIDKWFNTHLNCPICRHNCTNLIVSTR